MRTSSSVDLYWLPLGAGGHFVRFNGRVFETIAAHREHRQQLDLYHTALVVAVPEGRFVIEDAWPIPDRDGSGRGVTVEGPVGHPLLGRFRVLRYEVRCWRDGVIADVAEAVESPQRISDDESCARRVLELVARVPGLTWGRRPQGAHEMWNSNSVISWLLAKSGLDVHAIHPPLGGRAPGWDTGVALATRMPAMSKVTDALSRTGRTKPSRISVSSGDVALDPAAEAFTGVFSHNGHDLNWTAVGGGVELEVHRPHHVQRVCGRRVRCR